MSFQVTLQPSGLGFSATSDETILEAALAGGLLIPYSCRDGACGVCKSKVLAGEVDHGRYSESTLTVAEREAGMALLCCAHPRSDLIVEVRQVSRAGDIPVKKLPCRVQKLTRIGAAVIVLEVKLPASEKFQFVAGQYIDFLLADGKRIGQSLAEPDLVKEAHAIMDIMKARGAEVPLPTDEIGRASCRERVSSPV